MARLLWLVFMLALVSVLLAGASWAAAYSGLGNLLGAPPPVMGTQKTTFLWDGLPTVRGHPRVWKFSFYPTRIPGAPEAVVYVSPIGRVILTDPSDLAERIKAYHNTGY
jgi:hypothetical protein